jgi:hypothetical protein
MKTKNLILSILISFVFSNIFSQDRVDSVALVFNKQSEQLKNAIGWKYNSESGKWIDNENVISKDKIKGISKLLKMSYLGGNFISIETKSLTYNDDIFYVLIIKKVAGEYEYPHIKEGWIYFEKVNGYIFNSVEYSKLTSADSLITLVTKNNISMGSKNEKYDENVFLNLIRKKLAEKQNYNEYFFPIIKTKDGLIRFQLPSSIRFDFKNEYFETDLENFNKIILK